MTTFEDLEKNKQAGRGFYDRSAHLLTEDLIRAALKEAWSEKAPEWELND